jgi:acyl carrier protein
MNCAQEAVLVDRPAAPVRDRVADLVKDILQKNSISRPVEAGEGLVALGLTSIDMVHLMLAVEAAFDIAIPQSGITPENFRSIASIEAMIERLALA